MTSPSDISDDGPRGARRSQVVGVGLIGGSIGLALRERGWYVTGSDHDPARAARAAELGALDAVGTDEHAEVTFVATPVGVIADEVKKALARGGIVTDVGSVKAAVVTAVDHPRFVGGHPMAGSEQEGVDGADADLFEGATWVLTPTPRTDADAYLVVRSIVSSLGAEVVAIDPARHDSLVAVVSHVPHLTAATLMGLASHASEEHATLLRLAAGGFRDMTRIAAGHPGIWPDICTENRDAIVATLDDLLASLRSMREVVKSDDRKELLRRLESARTARINLPTQVRQTEALTELRVPVLDRPGVLAEITTLAGELGVNIEDLEIAHSAEGSRGVLVVVVESAASDLLRGALMARGYRPSARALE